MSPRSRPRWSTAAVCLLAVAVVSAACSGGRSTVVAPPDATPTALIVEAADVTPTPPPPGGEVESSESPSDGAVGEYTLEREAYGDLPSQFGVLWLPTGVDTPPVVVLIHGGFWQDRFGLLLMDPIAEDLVRRGYAVWNIEYRRVGADGGGWPTTFDDVAAAVDHLAPLAFTNGLDLGRVALVGHSAGGHLALWAAGRESIPSGEPWSDPVVTPLLTVGQAPVVDLVAASEGRAGGGAVDAFLGGAPDEVPERYAAATPSPDVSGRLLIVIGDDDAIVGVEWTGGAPQFEAARLQVADTDHFDVIDPTHRSWELVVGELDRALGPVG